MIKGDGPVATVTVQLPSFRDREKIMTILRTCSGISFYEVLEDLYARGAQLRVDWFQVPRV